MPSAKGWYCSQVLQQIKHFISRNALNIDGMGEANIKFFLKKGFISNIVDIFYLKNHATELAGCMGWGQKSVAFADF